MTPMLLFLLIVLSFPNTAAPIGEVLKFPTPSTANYVILRTPDFARLATSFTVCTWIKPLTTSITYPVWFSYQVASSDDEITLSSRGTFHYLMGTNIGSAGPQLDSNIWSHVCLGWNLTSTTGNLSTYVNGAQTATIATASGRKLKTGGVLVLGQDQDSRGGGFSASQVFAGELYGLQMFDKKLSGEEVQYMYEAGRCGVPYEPLLQNVVLDWTDFWQAEKNGAVKVLHDTCSLWELVRGVIKDDLLDLLKKLSEHRIKMEHLTKCGTLNQWELIRGMVDDDLLEHLIKYHPFNE